MKIKIQDGEHSITREGWEAVSRKAQDLLCGHQSPAEQKAVKAWITLVVRAWNDLEARAASELNLPPAGRP